jgi:hypothetical protein
MLEYERDTPKMNVECGLLKDCVIGPFFHVTTVTGNVYLYMFQNFAVDQISHGSMFQHDCAHPEGGSSTKLPNAVYIKYDSYTIVIILVLSVFHSLLSNFVSLSNISLHYNSQRKRLVCEVTESVI